MSAENDNQNDNNGDVLNEVQPPESPDPRDQRFSADSAKLLPQQKSAGRTIVMICAALAVVAGMARPVYREIKQHMQGREVSAVDARINDATAQYALNDPAQWMRDAFSLKLQRAIELSFNFVEGNAPSFTDAKAHFTDSGWDDFVKIQRDSGLVSGDKPKAGQRFSIIKGPSHFQVISNGLPVVEPLSYRIIFEGIGTSGKNRLTYICRAALMREDDNLPLDKVQINGIACTIAGLPK